MAAVALLHREQIIERVAKGEYLASIASDLGLAGKGQAISNALAKDPEYLAAREVGLESKLAHREGELESAEPTDVPRARELLSHARWRAEREAPHRWGAKQQIEHSGAVLQVDGDMLKAAGDLLGLVRERVITATIEDPVTNSLIDKE